MPIEIVYLLVLPNFTVKLHQELLNVSHVILNVQIAMDPSIVNVLNVNLLTLSIKQIVLISVQLGLIMI